MIDTRPAFCRNKLRDEGKPYPRSGCNACHMGGMLGCPHERIHAEVPVSMPFTDGRPAGWTEARALEYIANELHESKSIEFARLFVHGEWRKVTQEFPDFVEWIAKQ